MTDAPETRDDPIAGSSRSADTGRQQQEEKNHDNYSETEVQHAIALQAIKYMVKEETHTSAINTVASFCLCFKGLEWLVETSDDGQSFAMLTKLTANEIRILMPMAVRHVEHGDKREIENDRLLERPINKDEYDTLASCYVILECCIETLSQSDQVVAKLDTQQLTSLLTQLKEAVLIVCDFLRHINGAWHRLMGGACNTQETIEQTSATTNTDIQPIRSCGLGALRLVCVWCANEPVTLKADYQSYLLELMFRCLRHEMEQVSSWSLIVSSTDDCQQETTTTTTATPDDGAAETVGTNYEASQLCDIVILALHSVCTADDETGRHVKAIDGAVDTIVQLSKWLEAQRKSSHHQSRRMRYALVNDLVKIVMDAS